jgi:hypothetical protein
MSVCVVDSCGKSERYLRFGMCQKHYLRWKKHGDVTVVLPHQGRPKGTYSHSAESKSRIGSANTKHGMSNSATHITWMSMMRRCNNANASQYSYYGGRGISVCDRWRDFRNFLADMGERPDGRTLDRIDNDGNYEPGNCRWATRSQQSANRRRLKQSERG